MGIKGEEKKKNAEEDYINFMNLNPFRSEIFKT